MIIEHAVTLEEAKTTCAAWRVLLSEMIPGVTNENLFRGFYIPIDDIKALAKHYEAVAVRAYIATNPLPAGSEITGHELRLMLVPVVPVDGEPLPGKDHIVPLEHPGDPGLVSIYDFTRPCPHQCDKGSVLYNIEMKIADK